MRALILSDLHIEHAPYGRPTGNYDVVILAGDIHNGVNALVWARDTFPDHRIVQIAGNHEYYDHEFQSCREAMHATARSLQIDFLDDSSVVIDNVEFFGCTLWTDFRFFETAGRAVTLSREAAMQANLGLIADYWAIQYAQQSGVRPFAPADSVLLHERSLHWLTGALEQSRQRQLSGQQDGHRGSERAGQQANQAVNQRVVVSHHLPSARSVSARFASAVTNAAFVSDLDALIPNADWWIHGHTHASHCYQVAATTVLANPRGYPSRRAPGLFENRAFESALIVDFATAAGRPQLTAGTPGG